MLGTQTSASFKTRARAVDMLGRQQIAGIPTAISELFKNAHDAYADHVEADFFKTRGLFVVRDDGIGMSYQQFVNNWLTLATDIKVGEPDADSTLLIPPGAKKRPTLGEKGIGRLAIASIGPQVLVLTRPFSHDGATGLLAAFISWDLFALPGINLDEIKIPIRVFRPSESPVRSDINDMITSVRDSLNEFSGRVDETSLTSISDNLDRFQISEDDLTTIVASNLCGTGRHGTQFWIQPTDEALILDIEGSGSGDEDTQLVRMLIGFSNTMTPEHAPSVIKTAFRLHEASGDVVNLIDENDFFSTEEFETADHHLQGHFDEFGQFKGTIKIYGLDPVDHVLPWRSAHGRKTRCGPFDLNVAVVQGEQRHSLLPPQEWAIIINKMNRIGGLYIYKDGIRVLPYGNADYDFLDIEKNRTKSASYYYFSFRRMFGAVQINQRLNPQLVEKAGREGFRENSAYREFRGILMNFFLQIAADFFRQGGYQTSIWEEQRAELERLEQIKRRRQQQVSVRRRELQRELETFFSSVDEGEPQIEVGEVLQSLRTRLDSLSTTNGLNSFSADLLAVETRARRDLKRIKDSLHIVRPRGVGLSRDTRRDWDSYRTQMMDLEENTFASAEREIDEVVRRSAAVAKFWIDHRRRLEAAIDANVLNIRQRARRETTETREVGKEVSDQVIELTQQVMSDVEGAIREVLAEVARTDFSNREESEFVEVRTSLEEQLGQATVEALGALASARAQLQGIEWDRVTNGNLTTQLDVLEATESELLDARDRAEVDFEMAQLGAAIHVINHEFDASIRKVRSSLRTLQAWADVNPSLQSLHDDIRTSFEHLDGYLTMFTPLQRRLYRKEVEIRGTDIVSFLSDLFSERLKRHDVALDSTRNFKRHVVVSYPSTFYPVFVNLIDNSLFWLSDRPRPRRILLDCVDDTMIVADSGPGIPERDWLAAFELGFTRKPSGRGLGLYIAREALRRVDYNIEIQPHGPLNGACFHITPYGENED